MNQLPLCFILMPFGQKDDPAGLGTIDFDRIYTEALAPAIRDAEMEPIRADEERTGGIIHKPMFERLLLCDYAVADLTTANANVFYELGIRHTARPSTTLTLFAKHQPIPFDVNFLRSMPYALGPDNQFGSQEIKALRQAVTQRLIELRQLAVRDASIDSPLFQLLAEWEPGNIARLKTDVFRDQVMITEQYKDRLTSIRAQAQDTQSSATALQTFRAEIGPIDAIDTATIVDLMLTYRALADWDGMIAVYEEMPETLKRQILVREQLGFAYNRRAGTTQNKADRAKALQILTEVDTQQGPSSETLGLIGRIHKDQWQEAHQSDHATAAKGHLNKAIDAYRRGYLADLRDAYPGVNLLTLLDINGNQEALQEKDRLLPVVRFAVEQRLASSTPDYWDHATMLELAVLDESPDVAYDHLANALASVREPWEAKSTANNLQMITEARQTRSANISWIERIIQELQQLAE